MCVPTEGDYILSDSGPLGSRMTVVEYQGAADSVHEFATEAEAHAYIRAKMERERYWPDVWYMDDHGGMRLLDYE